MRARSVPEITSVAEARALLGLVGPVARHDLKIAFRTAIKAADDPDHYRRVIAAWRLLQTQGSPLPALPASELSVSVTPLQALQGDRLAVEWAGRQWVAPVPIGVRTGDTLRLKCKDGDGVFRAPVLIRSEHGLGVVGDDLYMTTTVCPRLLNDGGRVEIATHAGPRSAWITPGLSAPRLRLRGLGLPPRGRHSQGHLFVTLKAAIEQPTPAEDLLLRFSRAWAEPLAA